MKKRAILLIDSSFYGHVLLKKSKIAKIYNPMSINVQIPISITARELLSRPNPIAVRKTAVQKEILSSINVWGVE